MTSLALPVQHRRTRSLRAGTLLVAALAVLLAGVALGAASRPSLVGLRVPTGSPGRVAGAGLAYLASHLLRCLRLALLVHRPGVRFREVARLHAFTAGLGVLVPFKLSEIVRVREVAVLRGSWRTGLLVVWLERMLDAAVLTGLLCLALAGGRDALGELVPALAVIGGFAVASFLIITVLPGNARGLMLYLVRRPSGAGGLALLRACRVLLITLGQVPRLVSGKVATLLLVSLLAWSCELLAVGLAFSLAPDAAQLSSGVLAVVSTVSVGVTAVMAGTEDRLVEVLGPLVADPRSVELYRTVLVLPLLVLGALAGLSATLRARRRGWR